MTCPKIEETCSQRIEEYQKTLDEAQRKLIRDLPLLSQEQKEELKTKIFLLQDKLSATKELVIF